MYEPFQKITGKLRWPILGTLISLATLLISSLLVPGAPASASVDTSALTSDTVSTNDSPNVITNGVTLAANQLTGALASTGQLVNNGRQSAATSLAREAKYMANSIHSGATNVNHGLVSSAQLTATAVNKSVAVIIYIPRTLLGFVAATPTVSSFIKPSERMTVPTIDTLLPATIAARSLLPATAGQAVGPATSPDLAAAWPIHGRITTLFGVPELPYQAIHTGLDISDGLPAGTTPVKPFKAGRVVQVLASRFGLGNHVVVDHGAGVTSVYGHLYSILVQAGQQVDTATILGLEGSTGVSTGTHLHFEIRVNGQAIDPHRYINGQP